MIAEVNINGETRKVIVMPKNSGEDEVEFGIAAIEKALMAVTMSPESYEALTSTSMYFLLQLLNILKNKR
jgi:hypothetical protein